MEITEYEIGRNYHIRVKSENLDFTGTLLEIYPDGSGKFVSAGTGKTYIIILIFADML